jgi:protein required for attachment to host cells
MNEVLVIVADSASARFYRFGSADAPHASGRLLETVSLQHPDLAARNENGRPPTETNTNRQAGPVHPIGAQRERHRLEHERRFARDIAFSAAVVTKDWAGSTVVLVAEPRMLGLLREPLRTALSAKVVLKELAKDYAQLDAVELLDRLAKSGVISVRTTGA